MTAPLKFSPSRIQQVELGGKKVDILRLDEIHPWVNGNKWFKLRYNLEAASGGSYKGLITFGGPWSNHLYATAQACRESGMSCFGIVRGERPAELSETLRDAIDAGMELEFISREMYDLRDSEELKGWIRWRFGNVWIVPEGGSNFLGINGAMEMVPAAIARQYEVIAIACGTGGSVAGLRLSAPSSVDILGVPVLRGEGYMPRQVRQILNGFLGDPEAAAELTSRISFDERWHFGGYAKYDQRLIDFIRRMEMNQGLMLDQVYTAKLLYGIEQRLLSKETYHETNMLVVHTGGLQGRRSLGAIFS
ncbi:MAG: 1-aminocyclopropane-1-carboxylate deaminase/D-cysteine desulfhydrase [Flavobacteriales bacterium]|jgi:1-aminocyclopropane-1-carboxylate deaminase